MFGVFSRRLYFWALALFGGGCLALYFSESVFRPLLLVLAPVVGVFLMLAIWTTYGADDAGRRRRWMGLALGVVGCLLLGGGLLRVDGSVDGSSIPRLVWRWAEPEGSGIGALEVLPKTMNARLEAPLGARDSNFLGKARDGKVETSAAFDWDARPPGKLWHREVGLGWSAFAVSGGYAITQEQRGEDELVSCYRLGDGEALWKYAVEARFSEHFGGDGPRATPVVSGDVVYAQGATGMLLCLDLVSGKEVWKRDVLADSEAKENLEWGKSNTPLITEDFVIVTGGVEGATLVAYPKSGGEPAWMAGTDEASYSSPSIIMIEGEPLIVSVNAHSVTAHTVDDGEVRWTFDWPGPFPKVGQAVPAGEGRILVTAGYDGVGTFLLGVTSKSVVPLWETNRLKTKFSSAVVYGDHAYGLHQGRLSCISLEDGARSWRGEKLGYGQNLLLPGGRLLIQAEDGRVVVAECNSEDESDFVQIRALSGKSWNVPTVAGRYLLVRNATEAACFLLNSPLEAP